MRFHQHIFLLAVLGIAAGCDTTEVAHSTTTTADPNAEFRAFSYWDEVRCDIYGDGCWGRLASSELWIPVVSSTQLNVWDRMGILDEDPLVGWSQYTCDPGGRPQEAPAVRCFYSNGGNSSVCYAGGDGWYAVALPACSVAFTSSQWPNSSCDIDKQFGSHSFDAVFSHSTYDEGRAVIGDEAYAVRPLCALENSLAMTPAEEYVHFNPYESGSYEESCCYCHSGGTWACLAWRDGAQACIDYGYEQGLTVSWSSYCAEAQTQGDDDDVMCWASCA